MKRRTFLAATATGAIAGASGCLSGEVVLEKRENITVPAHEGWSQKIDGVDGSGEVGYTVKSEDARFEVFYFTETENFEIYQEYAMSGDGETEDIQNSDERPTGHRELSSVARPTGGVFEAQVPDDGSRYSLDIENAHYLVVDHSNYGTLPVDQAADDLLATIDLEVTKSRF